jgi:mono/diheme cytochrome c family protein
VRLVRPASIALLAAGLASVACTKPVPTSTSFGADTAVASASDAATPADGKALVTTACLSCHAEEMLAQQRLPREKWAATVKKMTGWGANLDPTDTDALVAYLAASYGPDAGPWQPPLVAAAAATSALEPLDDGPYAGGDPASGSKLFATRCAACHGVNARGGIGVNLVERPLLFRADYVATTVRMGRGKMVPLPTTTDHEVADILAHLRTLRAP